MSEMQVMDRTGHTSVKWNPDDRDEVSTARTLFNEMREKGYRAFIVGRMGRQGERIDEFDPEAGHIMLVPQLKGG